ncbi:hypothetical protein KKA50_02400 [Patescibacteria group bacterium]|nr:hypothetical protein [Patescibacteria group bacterium]
MTTYKTRKNIPALVFTFSMVAFVLSQLVINAVLNPLGTELQNLNKEKNFLVEENRTMEEQVAKTSSITVIKKLADKQLNISSQSQKSIIYLEQSALLAEK